MIRKSELFVKDMKEYIEKDFLIDYYKEINVKILKLIDTWETKLRLNSKVEN